MFIDKSEYDTYQVLIDQRLEIDQWITVTLVQDEDVSLIYEKLKKTRRLPPYCVSGCFHH